MPPSVQKADPHRPRRLTLRHQTSGATKEVDYLGMIGSPLRAHIHWPGGFDFFLVSPRTGALVAEGGASPGVTRWQLIARDHDYIREQYRLERARQSAVSDSGQP